MKDWEKEIEKAKENFEKQAFIVELDREVAQNSSLRIVERVESSNGKLKYRVISENPKEHWY